MGGVVRATPAKIADVATESARSSVGVSTSVNWARGCRPVCRLGGRVHPPGGSLRTPGGRRGCTHSAMASSADGAGGVRKSWREVDDSPRSRAGALARSSSARSGVEPASRSSGREFPVTAGVARRGGGGHEGSMGTELRSGMVGAGLVSVEMTPAGMVAAAGVATTGVGSTWVVSAGGWDWRSLAGVPFNAVGVGQGFSAATSSCVGGASSGGSECRPGVGEGSSAWANGCQRDTVVGSGTFASSGVVAASVLTGRCLCLRRP